MLHAELPNIGGHVLMATDMLQSMGQQTRIGNNTTPCLDVDGKEDDDRLDGALAEGGSEGSPTADMPWGAHWGITLDRYGIRWMVNHTSASERPLTPSSRGKQKARPRSRPGRSA